MTDTSQPKGQAGETTGFFAKLAKAVALACIGGLFGALITYFADDLRARAERLIFSGKLNGEYVLQTFVYNEVEEAWKPYTINFKLNHAGTHVFGTLRSATSEYAWRAYGYFRDPVLSLSYENVESAAAGTGTYTFKQDVPYVMWGHWIGVECDDKKNQKFVAQCPVLLYRSDHASERKRYESFMSRPCVAIGPDAGACPINKTAKAKPQPRR